MLPGGYGAFNFTIANDLVRTLGDRFIVCESSNGVRVNISGPLPDEVLPSGSVEPHGGLEHICFDSEDVDADIERLSALGAELLEGPIDLPTSRICFMRAPDDVRIELSDRVAREKRAALAQSA